MSDLVLFKYDRVTGQIFDATGAVVGTWMDARPFESEQKPQKVDSVNQMLQLKSAGFTADEIIKLLGATE